MSEIAIVVDSTADIPEDLIKKQNIPVIPHILRWGGENLLDGVDINPDEFYERLQSTSEFPTTAQPSAGEFAEFFKNVNENAESILAILISDHLSSTLDKALARLELYASMKSDLDLRVAHNLGMNLFIWKQDNIVFVVEVPMQVFLAENNLKSQKRGDT